MGRGIAIAFVLAGFTVRLVDMKPRSASHFNNLCADASGEIGETLSMLSDFGLLPSDQIDRTQSLISFFPDSDCAVAMADADIVFEAVPETIEAKQHAMRMISEHTHQKTVVASTTSTILSDELQSFVTAPSRFLNAHWLNPAFLVPLVEISPGSQTAPSVVVQLRHLLERIGKVPVVCSASPGYIVPRIQALAMNEAARMVEEGITTANDIDKATRYGFGFRFAVLGLLEFVDWGGGDILYYASRYMTKAMQNERYAAPAIIESNMRDGRTGMKAGQGFLDYSNIDISEYQRGKLSEFVSLLNHIGKLPVSSCQTIATSLKPSNQVDGKDACHVVRQYLDAMESRDLEKAQTYIGKNFSMTFPGGAVFSSLQELLDWSKLRYQSIGKHYEHFDQMESGKDTIVYCYGYLHGVWLDGTAFSEIRFIDRFTVTDGLISSQLVWNDLAEAFSNWH
jgi:3-hydroxybutyryl-CoA dehydrogenase